MIAKFKEYDIDITKEQERQFNRYYELLVEWNKKINLTAITEYEDVIYKHFIDSVSIVRAVDLNCINSVIDVGTGGGFPGIPIKILYPHIKLTLLDSLNKRINFLNLVIDELNLLDVDTIHGRAEDYGHDVNRREKYDLCVSRAVANLSTLTELCIPFVTVDGIFVSYKSEKADDEIYSAKKAFELLNCSVSSVEAFSIKDNDRKLIKINKNNKTANKYPRKAGTPAKNPL